MTVMGYVARVAVVANGETVATHQRCIVKQATILGPIQSLASLERKSATLDHARVFRDWKMPASIALLQSELARIPGPADDPGSKGRGPA